MTSASVRAPRQDPRFAHEVRFQSGLARPPSFAAPPHAAPAPHGAPPHAYDVPHAGPSFRVAVPAAPAVPAAHDPRAYEAQGYAPFAEPLPLSPAGAPGEEKKHSCPHCLKRCVARRPDAVRAHLRAGSTARAASASTSTRTRAQNVRRPVPAFSVLRVREPGVDGGRQRSSARTPGATASST